MSKAVIYLQRDPENPLLVDYSIRKGGAKFLDSIKPGDRVAMIPKEKADELANALEKISIGMEYSEGRELAYEALKKYRDNCG